ncbi:phosphopantetheine-binding protein [Mycobacteroides abscessus]|uniref:phosphopantetheine-binding protein n=1 Tax=Mycobacteroides abscessus TaxID=36809 RepID=UPI000C255C74|nr:phosphopantetheine-binding protein [Mycobacteroides abscessus]
MAVEVDDVKATVESYLTDMGIHDLADDMQLDELDIDSIDVVNILTEIKEKHGAEIKRTEVAEITLGELAALAVERAGV